jgi:hypothetical protein
MRIKKGAKRGIVANLTRDETKEWEDSSERGDRARRRFRTEAQEWAKKKKVTSGNIEIYAAQAAGGWVADLIPIESD